MWIFWGRHYSAFHSQTSQSKDNEWWPQCNHLVYHVSNPVLDTLQMLPDVRLAPTLWEKQCPPFVDKEKDTHSVHVSGMRKHLNSNPDLLASLTCCYTMLSSAWKSPLEATKWNVFKHRSCIISSAHFIGGKYIPGHCFAELLVKCRLLPFFSRKLVTI